MRVLASAVLIAEALVVFFATLVAQGLGSVSTAAAWAVGVSISLLCFVTAGLLRRRSGFVLGSVLQVLLIFSGFVVPLMFGLGALFAALWVAALMLGARAERIRRSWPSDGASAGEQ